MTPQGQKAAIAAVRNFSALHFSARSGFVVIGSFRRDLRAKPEDGALWRVPTLGEKDGPTKSPTKVTDKGKEGFGLGGGVGAAFGNFSAS